MKVNRLKLNDPSYPDVLRTIPSAPKELYFVGTPPVEWLGRPRLAVVGSRKASPYGREVTKRLAGELAEQGIVIISGLALGVDSIAHQAALDSQGLTAAVLPTSLDTIYPASHVGLAKRIIDSGGTLISEYPPASIAFKQNFIARNRIVSGLANGLLITEAAAASGSLHTARFALDQGKIVMAVPGNITSPGSEGTNSLIKSGALPVTSAEDIFFALNIKPGKKQDVRPFRGSPKEKRVLELIIGGTGSQEELATSLGIDGAELGSILTILEINGYIRPAGGGFWLGR